MVPQAVTLWVNKKRKYVTSKCKSALSSWKLHWIKLKWSETDMSDVVPTLQAAQSERHHLPEPWRVPWPSQAPMAVSRASCTPVRLLPNMPHRCSASCCTHTLLSSIIRQDSRAVFSLSALDPLNYIYGSHFLFKGLFPDHTDHVLYCTVQRMDWVRL